MINTTAAKVFEERGESIHYKVGTMIEVPRAALTANKIAEVADFFSFGTNDLTQMTFGYSRDDAPKFLKFYKENGIVKVDPFEVLDQEGVGQLVKMGVEKLPLHKSRPQGRYLRRARWRALKREVLRQTRHELRQLLTLPRAHRPRSRGAGCNRGLSDSLTT